MAAPPSACRTTVPPPFPLPPIAEECSCESYRSPPTLTNVYKLTIWLIHLMPAQYAKMHNDEEQTGVFIFARAQNFLAEAGLETAGSLGRGDTLPHCFLWRGSGRGCPVHTKLANRVLARPL